jgi:conjugative transposon TraM protein
VNVYRDPNVDKVNQQLAKLNAVLNQPAEQQHAVKDSVPVIHEAMANEQVSKLENMVQAIHQQDTATDPQMQQLNAMMDKILDIQHPERVQAAIKEQSQQHKQEMFPVVQNDNKDNISVLEPKKAKDIAMPVLRRNAFYSLDDNLLSDLSQNSIPAVVQETQTLVTGATVKMRLLNDVYINGVLVPKDCFVFGTASLSGERLNINIASIRYQNAILPVSLSVYDLDGMTGIFIPGAITRDVAKQSADEATQSIGLTTLDPSLGAQAASAGIQAAKSLIGKKIRLVKVTVKAGYQVLLKDNNNKQ